MTDLVDLARLLREVLARLDRIEAAIVPLPDSYDDGNGMHVDQGRGIDWIPPADQFAGARAAGGAAGVRGDPGACDSEWGATARNLCQEGAEHVADVAEAAIHAPSMEASRETFRPRDG